MPAGRSFLFYNDFTLHEYFPKDCKDIRYEIRSFAREEIRREKMNEVLLIAQLIVFYGMVILAYRLFGRIGLYCWTAIATILANIEVLIQVHAFGMDMTLGNIMFASTFLVTDILSEVDGKKQAQKGVHVGIAASLAFIVISQSWILFTPNEYDFAMPAFQTIFSNTPRLIIASFVVYMIVQQFDVWAYHKWWAFTTRVFGDNHKFLWLRNNGSTLLSQLLNAILYTFFAFYGVMETETLWSLVWASYVIFIFTSLLDTPAVYICRFLKERGHIPES